MTKEQAYEKLELPIGTDLQVVRQKFQQMHNDFRVQIDGSFSVEMRQRKEQQFEELKEAFALLNESTSVDDSASLPHTEKKFDHLGGNPETQVPQENSSERERPWSSPYGVPPVPPQQPEPQVQARQTESNHSPIREPKWWYVVISIPLIIAGIFLFAELATGRGYQRGLFGQIFCWVAGTIVGNFIILNHFSPTLVPPYLRGSWFRGNRSVITILVILALSSSLVYTLYTTGATNTKIYGMRWGHYTEIAAIGIVILQMIWFVFMGLMFLVGLASPRTLYFWGKGSVAGAFACLIGYQLSLIFCLFIAMPSDTALTRLSDDSYNKELRRNNNSSIQDEDYDELTDSVGFGD